MKKLVPALIVAVIVVAFAAALVWQTLSHGDSFAPGETAVVFTPVVDDHPLVMWSIASSGNEDAKGYSYSLVTKQTTGPVEGFEGPGVVRFNQSTNLCDSAYVVSSLGLNCEISDGGVLKLTAFDGDGGPQLLQKTIDPVRLGILPADDNGYLVPVAAADDKSAIYLGLREENVSYVIGLWRLDVPSGVITEIAYVGEHKLYQYDINPTTKQLVGVTFVPPEGLGEMPTGPSKNFLVDLKSGEGKILEGGMASENVIENPMLSLDGTVYSFYESGPTRPGSTTVLTVTGGRYSPGWKIDGVAKDWFGDTMVVDRDGNLFLYDLATKAETQLTHETDATVEYLGVVR